MNKLILLVPVVLLVAGCAAKTAPPPANNVLSIPVTLVNVEQHNDVDIPDEPSTGKIVKITKGDDKEAALDDMIDYTQELHDYAKEVTRMLVISDRENAVMRSKLTSIKKYIILSQQPDYAVPPTVQPVPNY